MIIAPPGWGTRDIEAWLQKHKPAMDTDNYGQVILYIGLWEHEDGSLHDTPDPKTAERILYEDEEDQ